MKTNQHLLQNPVNYGAPMEQARLMVYGVHGRSQAPEFMMEVADRVDLPGVAWLLPAAHDQSWYPQSFLAPLTENQPALDNALETVRTHLDGVLGRREGPPVVVFGFSQGACLLSEYLLRDQPGLAGAVLHTGGYLGPSERDGAVSDLVTMADLSVRMFTARNDSWVPLQRVEATRSAFRSLGATVELTVYDDPEHHVNDDSVGALRRYLRQVAGLSPGHNATGDQPAGH
ncbi:phospholipase [Arthrobacter sp. APC 3897]|uniref:alpha/beta hydrolase n=1 Tax=Arthrobacter sp. APC 3897 TaxID=3035204 RepID=UPI0025B2FD40|nr:phospholipase [Arthrobacter sp. APC 3897]MDN3482406.1 phospholipase [Arthrobacter sp. APC 3897]